MAQLIGKKRKKFFKLGGFFAGYPAKIWTEQYLSICDIFDGFWGYIGGVIGMKRKKVSFWGFESGHNNSPNPHMCLWLAGHSKGDLPAHLPLLVRAVVGLWGPLVIKKGPKMRQNCIFWCKTTYNCKALLPISSPLFHHNSPTIYSVVQLQNEASKGFQGLLQAKEMTEMQKKTGFLSFYDFCSAYYLPICLFSVCHSQGDTSAYMHQFLDPRWVCRDQE